MRYEKLIFVDPEKNSNKEYEMREKGDGTFDITFTRVGKTPQHDNQPLRKWDSKLNEKLKKGYRRITDLVTEVKSSSAKLSGEPTIDFLLEKLLRASKEAFSSTYRVSASSVTQAQVDEVQKLINLATQFYKQSDLDKTNKYIVDIWHVLPRTMSNVRDYLPKNLDRAGFVLAQEQDNIDNANVQKAFVSSDGDKDILQNLGITISPKLDLIPVELAAFLGINGQQVNAIHAISKPILDERFTNWVNQATDKTTSLRYHGTKWRNGMAILQTGLRILGSKSSTYSGSMLGDAIYTSTDFNKSYNYSDGLMFVLNVHIGKPLMVTEEKHVKKYTWEDLQRLGYDSVNADPGVHTGRVRLQRHEQTIYNAEQQTFLYLLDLK